MATIHNLETLQLRQAELSKLCKEKEEQISGQFDYISENLGMIALHSVIGVKTKKGDITKTEIVRLLISESIETALTIHGDPTHIKDKLIALIRKIAAGVVKILVK